MHIWFVEIREAPLFGFLRVHLTQIGAMESVNVENYSIHDTFYMFPMKKKIFNVSSFEVYQGTFLHWEYFALKYDFSSIKARINLTLF